MNAEHAGLSPTFYRRLEKLELPREVTDEDLIEDEPPTLRMLTRDERASVEKMEAKLSSPPVAIGVAETTVAVAAGAALGAIAGPIGALAGACVGCATGALAFLAAQEGEKEKADHDRVLDAPASVRPARHASCTDSADDQLPRTD
ncbi:MAG: hypothetical protein U0174_27015 [Polyangiaceae bacterium]